MSTLPKPDYATPNMRLVGYSDQAGKSDGVQIMVHQGYAYIGHIFSKGFSIVDVRDPSAPKFVRYVAAPPNTWTLQGGETTNAFASQGRTAAGPELAPTDPAVTEAFARELRKRATPPPPPKR